MKGLLFVLVGILAFASYANASCDFQKCASSLNVPNDASKDRKCTAYTQARTCLQGLTDCGTRKDHISEGIQSMQQEMDLYCVSDSTSSASSSNEFSVDFAKLGPSCNPSLYSSCLSDWSQSRPSAGLEEYQSVIKNGMPDCKMYAALKKCSATALCNFTKYTQLLESQPGAKPLSKVCEVDLSGGCNLKGVRDCLDNMNLTTASNLVGRNISLEGGMKSFWTTKQSCPAFFDPFSECVSAASCSLSAGIATLIALSWAIEEAPGFVEYKLRRVVTDLTSYKDTLDRYASVCDSSCGYDSYSTCLQKKEVATYASQAEYCKSLPDKLENVITCAKSSGCVGLARPMYTSLMKVSLTHCGKAAGSEIPPKVCQHTQNFTLTNYKCEEVQMFLGCWINMDKSSYGTAGYKLCNTFRDLRGCKFDCPQPPAGIKTGSPAAPVIPETIVKGFTQLAQEHQSRLDAKPATNGAHRSHIPFAVSLIVTVSFAYIAS